MSSVYRFDRVLVAPTAAALGDVLTEATKAANKGCRARTLAWTPADTHALLADVAAAPEGFRQWNGQGESKQRGWGKDTRSAVAVAWWTDPLRRVHYRVVAERIYCASSSDAKNFLCPYAERPPLWLVHPDEVYFREAKDAAPWAICRCGTQGPPEAIGWMGLVCAACHDRAEDGTLPREPGEPARTDLVGHTSWVGRLYFTPDGRSMYAHPRSGGMLRGWSLETGLELGRTDIPTGVGVMAFAPEGGTVVVGLSGRIERISTTDPTDRRSTAEGTWPDRLLDLKFSPDGATLAVAWARRVELRDADKLNVRSVVAELTPQHQPARLLAFSPDGGTLAIAQGYQRAVRLVDVATTQTRSLDIPGEVYSSGVVAFSPDGRTLGVIGSTPGLADLIDLATPRRIRLQFGRANGLAFAPDGRVVAVGGQDNSLRLFSVPDGRPLGVWFWHTHNVNDVAFSPDGRWLATSSDDGHVKLWPVAALLSSARPR